MEATMTSSSITLSSIENNTKSNCDMDFNEKQSNPDATKAICAQNQITDIIIASEVNKILLAT